MGNLAAPSEHMAGYSSAIAVAAQQLQQATINKHVKEMNDKNKRVRVKVEPNNFHPDDSEITFFNQVRDGVKSGKLKVTKTKTGFSVFDKTLGAKSGPKTNS